MNGIWRLWLGALIALAVFSGVIALALGRARAAEPPPAVVRCMPVVEAVRQLRDVYGQYVVAFGRLPNGASLLIASRRDAGFTVLVAGNGIACVVFAGIGLEMPED